MKNLIGILAVGMTMSSLAANTWWVDDDNFGKGGLDGKSVQTAYGTIQDALNDAKFEEGDTVKVLPGVYDRGGAYLETAGVTNRVLITKKCTIISTDGKSVTHIVGKHDMTDNGTGPAAIRCIHCSTTGEIRIEGFTIRDGAAAGGTQDSVANHSGGFLGSHRKHQIVDCVISNCVAYKGVAARYATLIRTLESGNRSTQAYGSINNSVTLYSCVVQKNAGGYACSTCDGFNCDFIANDEKVLTGGGKYCNLLFDGNTGLLVDSTTIQAFNFCTNKTYQMVAPCLGDYRPIIGADVVGAGDAGKSSLFTDVPVADRSLDFYGRTFSLAGACDIGAAQGAVPVAGGIRAGNGGLIVDGVLLANGECIFATNYPAQHAIRAVPVAGKWVYAFKRTDLEKDRFHPDLNDDAFVMPPPTGVTTVETVYAELALYVNPNKDDQGRDIGSDSNSGSESAPLHTLQKAIDKTQANKPTVIFAAAGFYTEGGKRIHDVQVNNSFVTNRVCVQSNDKRVRLIGAGPGKSFIVGAPDSGTGGNGPGAIRPVGVFCNYTTVQGFTLTNGYSAAASATLVHDKRGAVYGREANGTYVHVLDCEIVDCHGEDGVAGNVIFTRCNFHGTAFAGSGLNSCVVSSCVFDNGSSAAPCRNSQFYNCTIVNRATGGIASGNGNQFVSSILVGGSKLNSDDKLCGTLVWDIADLSSASGTWTVGNPYFADADGGDWRVRRFSKAVTCGEIPTSGGWGSDYWRFASCGLDGCPMTFVSGNPVAGCCQEICMDPGVFVEAGNGGISPSAGWHPIAPSGSLTVSAAPATRPCAGWIFAGTTNFFDETPSMTYVLDDCPTGALLDAFYTTDWYVDATKVDDSGTASTPGMAKKTFAGLFATGLVLAGDTVHAAEGLYEDGVMYRPEATDGNARVYAVGSRVIVPSGVTILADGRVSETVIKGASATSVANEYGLGPDAVRCVSLYPNAKIKGFTLTGGRTDSNTAVGEQKAKEYPDNIGALVHGIETSSSGSAKLQVAEDCVLANGVARRAGGASFANLIRCRVTDVRGIDSTGNGSATLRCYHSGTVVDDVKGGYAVMYPYTFISSTVRASVYPGFYNPYSLSGVKCSILDCSGSVTSGSTGKFVNTYLAVKLTNMTDENLDETSMIVGYDALEMDDECRPVVGKNVAIDKGSGAVYDAFRAEIGEKDATGVPRVMNGAIDIGAIEADWRPVYARDVTRSGRFEVTDVTSNVVETSEKTVGIGPNGVLLSAWTNTQVQEYTVRVKVSGTSAKIRFGDDERLVTASSEVQTLNFKGMPPISRLVLDNTGNDGVLEFLETKRLCGVILVVR